MTETPYSYDGNAGQFVYRQLVEYTAQQVRLCTSAYGLKDPRTLAWKDEWSRASYELDGAVERAKNGV